METTYTIITETKNKSLRKLYWDIALYIKSVDGVKTSKWFSRVIESSINLDLDCEEILDMLKEHYGTFDENISKQAECDFNSTRIYQLFISGGFSFRPIAPSLIFKHILQDKLSHIEIEKPKDKFIDLFEAERQFCYKDLSKIEQINHLKQFLNDLIDVKQFDNINNKMIISTYIVYYMIGTKWDLNDYKKILGGKMNE